MPFAALSLWALASVASGARAPPDARDVMEALLAAQRPTAPQAASLAETAASTASDWGLARGLVGAVASTDLQQRGALGLELRAAMGDMSASPSQAVTAIVQNELSVPARVAAYFKKVSCARTRSDWRQALVDKYSSKYASDADVSFIVRNLDAQAERDILMMDYLRALPGVACYFEHASADGRVWILTENLGDQYLAARFAELESKRLSTATPFMAFDESLPILMDLLHGVQSLTDKGVVHFDLSGNEAVALVKDKTTGHERRALISELGSSACAFGSPNEALSCDKLLASRMPGSATRLPAERLGTPYNVWQVGLVLAKMCLGEYPTDTFLARAVPNEDLRRFDSTGEGRQRIQAALGSFNLADDKAFQAFSKEYPDVAQLIARMLEKDPGLRISPAGAVQEVEKLIKSLDIPAPPKPKPPTLPTDWRPSDWKQAPPPSTPLDVSLHWLHEPSDVVPA